MFSLFGQGQVMVNVMVMVCVVEFKIGVMGRVEEGGKRPDKGFSGFALWLDNAATPVIRINMYDMRSGLTCMTCDNQHV